MNELKLGAVVRNVVSGALTSTTTAPFDEETFFFFWKWIHGKKLLDFNIKFLVFDS